MNVLRGEMVVFVFFFLLRLVLFFVGIVCYFYISNWNVVLVSNNVFLNVFIF